MFRLPWNAVYAVYAMNYIALHDPAWVPVQDLHRVGAIPPRYGSRILQGLRRAGLLEAMRGKGYRLALPASTITVRRILAERAGDDWSSPGECPMHLGPCSARPGCALSSAWRRAVTAFLAELDSVTLDKLPRNGLRLPCCPLPEARAGGSRSGATGTA